MVQIKMFAICLACVFVLSFVNCAENELRFDVANVEFTTVPNITQFLRTNPKIKLIQTLAQVKNPQVKDLITYRLGNRVSGDRLVARTSGGNQWSTPQDITLTLTYPATGTGSIVSYVQVNVEQSSNLGRGYVIAGGIGQRAIKIIIEAQRTIYFRHVSEIYGY